MLSRASAGTLDTSKIEFFGEQGKLFSETADDKLYLMDKSAFSTEDTTGFEGRVRIQHNYPEGGYEIKFKAYTAVCSGVGIEPYISLKDEHAASSDSMFTITNPGMPHPKNKSYVNLYWAACKGQFRKFR